MAKGKIKVFLKLTENKIYPCSMEAPFNLYYPAQVNKTQVISIQL